MREVMPQNRWEVMVRSINNYWTGRLEVMGWLIMIGVVGASTGDRQSRNNDDTRISLGRSGGMARRRPTAIVRFLQG